MRFSLLKKGCVLKRDDGQDFLKMPVLVKALLSLMSREDLNTDFNRYRLAVQALSRANLCNRSKLCPYYYLCVFL